MRPWTCRFFDSSQTAIAMEAEPEAVLRLRRRVSYWIGRLNLQPRTIRVQQMTKKWGSCSTIGTVTLATDLATHGQHFQDVVIVHELLHLRIRNHGKLFRALMAAHVPHWRETETQRRA